MNTDFRAVFSGVFSGLFFSAVILSHFVILANGDSRIACGKRAVTVRTSQSRIVGGRDAVEGAWPWQVSLQVTNKHAHVCGATVISQWWLLSAAHCFPSTNGFNNKNHWRAVMGLRDLSIHSKWTITRKIDVLILHEKYNNIQNDIAVLKVDRVIGFGDYIRAACLPKPGKFHIEKWNHCHVTGWGLMEQNGAPARILQEAEVKLISLETCQQVNWYGNRVTDKMICAGFAGGGIDACQGDSGGPLSCQLKGTDRFYVVGVVSWGQGCAQRFKPGVYTSTSTYGDWIEQKTGILISQSEDAGVEFAIDNGGTETESLTEKQSVPTTKPHGVVQPISLVRRNSPGRSIPLLNLIIVLYHFCS
ncbi:chymotrypsin-like elastase family member 2A [Rhincodon typus]|uniref:chymotrypsin-like elastase family member 2A n=1 Tax=Rhincodon typus TaxID=259920 RepID=UPI00202EE484|nr:chymotrypsin-like elastase family member 2A [Rhincodon typus]